MATATKTKNKATKATPEQPGPALLIDARNALYRAVFAVKAEGRKRAMNGQRNNTQYHYFVVFLRQISTWMNRYRPSSVHVFWDAPRSTVWRRKVLKDYKDRSGSTYVEDISEDLARTTTVSKAFFKHMNVRQYNKKEMEADDLIYAAVTMMHPRRSIIVSTDGDMTQIPFNFSSCMVYNPTKQEEVPVPECHPAIQKAITGDKSDSILGYYGIGPKKSALLLEEPAKLEEFLQVSGRDVFHRNLLLIDLSLNPKLMHNKIYVQRRLSEGVNFDESEIKDLIKKYKVNGMLQEYADLVPQFKKLT